MLGIFGLILAFLGAILLRNRPEFVAPWLTVVFAASMLLWIVVPLLVGMTDGALDPSRLSHLPIGGPKLIVSLTGAATAGIVPMFFFAGTLLPVLAARTLAEAFFTVLAAFTLLVMCVILAQVAATSMSGLLRGRKTRDVAAAILAVVAMSAGFFAQFGLDAVFSSTLEQVEAVERWMRWTPGGWLGQAIAFGREGSWAKAAALIVATWIVIVALAAFWNRLLNQLLTTSEELGGARTTAANFIPPLVQLLPGSDAFRAATARSFRSIRRDPREWSAIAAQLPLMLLVGLPITRLDTPEVVLFTGAVGVYAGMLNSNLFGIDGRAVWLDQVASPSMRPVLWGKTVAHALIVVPILIVVIIGLALWKGGWVYAIPAVALAVASFGSITGIVSVSSVRFALPMPEGANAFAGQGTGQSATQGMLLLMSLVLGFAMALPAIALLVGGSLVSPWIGNLCAPLGVFYGLFIWRMGINRAADHAESNAPELLARLTVRS